MSAPAPGREPCPHVVRLPVLGVETRFATNSPDVLEVIRATYGRWEALRERPEVVSPSDVEVRIVVGSTPPGAPVDARDREPESSGSEAGSRRPGEEPPARARPTLTDATTMRIDAPEGSGVADAARSEAHAVVTPGLVARPHELVEDWLEPLTLFLLGSRDRQPVHAAAVVGRQHVPRTERHAARRLGDVAILLAGPSGVGKSTLTYAAWRSGFRVLADEPVYVQLRPRFRVWGRRHRIHLPPDARAHFSELSGVAPSRLSSGKTKIVVTAASGGEPPCAERAGICLLTRGTGDRPSLERLPPERAVAEVTAHLDPGYDLFADTVGERVARVARGGAWRLHLAGPPRSAVPFLDDMVAEVREAD